MAGQGGAGGTNAGGTTQDFRDGYFPGGGGGAAENTGPAGSGAAGVVRVWCLREGA